MDTTTKLPSVSREKATEEITSWLDKKKVFESVRESQKDSVDYLIDAVMTGCLTLDETTNQLTHKLLFPDATKGEITEIVYKARLNDQMLRPHTQGLKPTDADGRLLAHMAALSGQPKNIIAVLDSADKKIMQSVVVFFV